MPERDDKRLTRTIGAATIVAAVVAVVVVGSRGPRTCARPSVETPPSVTVATIVEFQNEMELTPPVPDARRLEVARAISDVLLDVKRCMEGIYGTVFVDIAFSEAGEATATFAKKNLLPVETIFGDGCILAAAKKARISPGAPVVATYPFRNMAPSSVMKKAADDILDGKATVVVPAR